MKSDCVQIKRHFQSVGERWVCPTISDSIRTIVRSKFQAHRPPHSELLAIYIRAVYTGLCIVYAVVLQCVQFKRVNTTLSLQKIKKLVFHYRGQSSSHDLSPNDACALPQVCLRLCMKCVVCLFLLRQFNRLANMNTHTHAGRLQLRQTHRRTIDISALPVSWLNVMLSLLSDRGPSNVNKREAMNVICLYWARHFI